MKKIIYIAIFFAACSKTNDLNIPQEFQTSGNEVHVDFVADLSDYGISRPTKITKHGDILAIGQPHGEANVSLIDLITHTTNQWLPFGSGPNEAYSIYNLSVNQRGELAAFDFYTGILHRHNPTTSSRSATHPLALTGEEKHLSVIQGDNFIISTGLYKQGRYRFYSLDNNQTTYFVSYPEHPQYPDLSQHLQSILWASTVLCLRPDNKAFVCTDIRSAQIDICNIEEHSISLVCRHCYYYPHVDIDPKAHGPVAYYMDNLAGFQDVAVSNDRIFVLYSGKTYKDEKQNIANCSTLLVFDWDGTLLETRTLPQMATFISYDLEKNALYGTTPNAQLVRYNI